MFRGLMKVRKPLEQTISRKCSESINLTFFETRSESMDAADECAHGGREG